MHGKDSLGQYQWIQIQRRIPIRINEADQQKFFDWMHRAEIPYCPLQDLNKKIYTQSLSLMKETF